MIESIPDLCLLSFFAYQNSVSTYGIIRRAAKKSVVVIYTVMYTGTQHSENTLSSVLTMNHLIDFGGYALAGCKNFIILQNYFKKIF